MSDYISRELLLSGLNDIRRTYKEAKNYDAVSAIDNAIGEVKDTSDVDVAPIIHAHWEREDRKYALHKFRCSNCRCASPIDTQQFLTDYCGNCGAKMDEKERKNG